MKRQYFNELAPRWDSLPGPPDAPVRIEEFLDRVAPRPGETILDAGAGTGILAAGLDRRGCTFVEFDLAELMLAEARRKRGGAPGAYVCGDLLNMPFAAGSFDAVLCFNTLPHARPVGEALQALWTCVARGGRLAIGHMMDSQSLNDLHGTIGGAVSEDHLPPPAEVGAMLEELGARVIAAEESARHYLVIAEAAR
jgi:2-polyprenyl-3-methyl-5-hydroxy-6-metoxy-1,4-benzoquinol methylase